MRRALSRFFLVAFLVFFDTEFATRTCRSELIYFRKGGEAQLPARIDGTRIILSLPDGEFVLNREDVPSSCPDFGQRPNGSRDASKHGL